MAPACAREPVAAGAVAGKPQSGLQIIALTIGADGKEHRYRVEVAITPQQQAVGMMFRTYIPPATGMLFPLKPARKASFWMRNVPVPLDLLFIGANGRIRNIIEGAVPYSQAPLESLGEVVAVLELAGGEAARAGLKPGDLVRYPVRW